MLQELFLILAAVSRPGLAAFSPPVLSASPASHLETTDRSTSTIHTTSTSASTVSPSLLGDKSTTSRVTSKGSLSPSESLSVTSTSLREDSSTPNNASIPLSSTTKTFHIIETGFYTLIPPPGATPYTTLCDGIPRAHGTPKYVVSTFPTTIVTTTVVEAIVPGVSTPSGVQSAGCQLLVETVRMAYWAPEVEGDSCNRKIVTRQNEPPKSAVIWGTTVVSPTVLLSLGTLGAVNENGSVGTYMPSYILAQHPDQVSTNCGHLDPSVIVSVPTPGTRVNFADFVSPIPASAYLCMARCGTRAFDQPTPLCSTIYDDFGPAIRYPDAVISLQEAWKTCRPVWNSINDPPIALSQIGSPLQSPSGLSEPPTTGTSTASGASVPITTLPSTAHGALSLPPVTETSKVASTQPTMRDPIQSPSPGSDVPHPSSTANSTPSLSSIANDPAHALPSTPLQSIQHDNPIFDGRTNNSSTNPSQMSPPTADLTSSIEQPKNEHQAPNDGPKPPSPTIAISSTPQSAGTPALNTGLGSSVLSSSPNVGSLILQGLEWLSDSASLANTENVSNGLRQSMFSSEAVATGTSPLAASLEPSPTIAPGDSVVAPASAPSQSPESTTNTSLVTLSPSSPPVASGASKLLLSIGSCAALVLTQLVVRIFAQHAP